MVMDAEPKPYQIRLPEPDSFAQILPPKIEKPVSKPVLKEKKAKRSPRQQDAPVYYTLARDTALYKVPVGADRKEFAGRIDSPVRARYTGNSTIQSGVFSLEVQVGKDTFWVAKIPGKGTGFYK